VTQCMHTASENESFLQCIFMAAGDAEGVLPVKVPEAPKLISSPNVLRLRSYTSGGRRRRSPLRVPEAPESEGGRGEVVGRSENIMTPTRSAGLVV